MAEMRPLDPSRPTSSTNPIRHTFTHEGTTYVMEWFVDLREFEKQAQRRRKCGRRADE